jgi:hypothetical protein
LYNAPDDVKARFAEVFDLHATMRPDGSRNGCHVDLTANIPLEMEDDRPDAYEMVFSPSGCLHDCGSIPFFVKITEIIE